MTFTTGGKQGWRRLFSRLTTDQRERLLEILQEQALEEAVEAERFRADAEGLARVPGKRQRLLAIAEREAEHVRLLREQIDTLGATPREAPPPSPRREATLWERLISDLEVKRKISTSFCMPPMRWGRHTPMWRNFSCASATRKMPTDAS